MPGFWLGSWACGIGSPHAGPGAGGRGEARDVGRAGRGGSHPQPGAQIVQSEGIGQRQSIAPRLGRLGGVKHLIENPCRDQHAEDKALIGKADEYRKNEHVGQRLDELPVVHGAYPGNKAQEASQDRVSMQAGQVGRRCREERRGERPGRVRSRPRPLRYAYRRCIGACRNFDSRQQPGHRDG